MRNDERFEIERAFDLLPHIVGSSWAVIWFRLNEIKRPTPEEYRNKVLEYFKMMEPIFESYKADKKFTDMTKYIQIRKQEEYDKIISGLNKEVEKRYNRYIDYG
jgi:adenylate kinase family enzyme